jgi:DNA-directed RNA polymerase specialized sigma24 family protein
MTEDQMATAELVGRARQGDGNAFGIRMDPYRRELHVHRYRILGSAADAEDVLQETMLAAWPGDGGFGERASIRTWLYRIAIHRSLNALRSVSRRPVGGSSIAWTDPPGAARVSEAISLAFVAALPLLPFDNSSLARFGLPRTVQA